MSPAETIKINRKRLKDAWTPGTWPDYWSAMDYEINIRILWSEFMYDYIEQCKKTCNTDYRRIGDELTLSRNIDILHGAMGISGEAGEIMDMIKKTLFYRKPLDVSKLIEECGDLLWYMAILLDVIGGDFEEVMEKNIEKLRKRYNNGTFDPELAIKRMDENGSK